MYICSCMFIYSCLSFIFHSPIVVSFDGHFHLLLWRCVLTLLITKTGCNSYDVRMDWQVSDEEYELATDLYMQTGFYVTPEIVLQICDRIDIYQDSFARFRELVKPYLDKLWLKCIQVVHFEALTDCKGQAIALKLMASSNMKHVNDTLARDLAQPQYLTDKIENYEKYHELAFSKKDKYFATVAYVPKNDPFNRKTVKSFFKRSRRSIFRMS